MLVMCPRCKQESDPKDWRETENIYCEMCEYHYGLECPNCGFQEDFVYDCDLNPNDFPQLHTYRF